MKKLKISVAIVLLFINVGYCSYILFNSDDVLGIYWSPKKDAIIEIFKKNNKYYGKTLWVKTNRKDIYNPNKNMRNRDILGLEFIKDFTFDGDSKWSEGFIYDPESGNTYNSIMWLENKNLILKGYIGISLLGRSEIFERIK